jgi:hypothetical protein
MSSGSWSAASLARPTLVGRGSLVRPLPLTKPQPFSIPTFCCAKTRAEPLVYAAALNDSFAQRCQVLAPKPNGAATLSPAARRVDQPSKIR